MLEALEVSLLEDLEVSKQELTNLKTELEAELRALGCIIKVKKTFLELSGDKYVSLVTLSHHLDEMLELVNFDSQLFYRVLGVSEDTSPPKHTVSFKIVDGLIRVTYTTAEESIPEQIFFYVGKTTGLL